jgi:hypothetical protein
MTLILEKHATNNRSPTLAEIHANDPFAPQRPRYRGESAQRTRMTEAQRQTMGYKPQYLQSQYYETYISKSGKWDWSALIWGPIKQA